jgi:hypothetical protein
VAYQQFSSLEDLIITANHVASFTQNRTSFHLAAYPAVGRIVGLVVSSLNINQTEAAAMYGLGHAYGCRLVAEGPRGCEELYSTPTWLVCALGVFLGSFLALVGHRFFKCSQMIFGFYLGSVVAYIVIGTYYSLDSVLVLGLAGLCGLTSAAGILALWWFLGIPVISVILPLLEVGVLVACVFMSLPVKQSASFASDTTYWLTFACISLVPNILLIAFTQKASIISCAVVGMVTVIFCVDHFTRSSLKYILIDVVRRATVPDFGRVILAGPPFEKTDLFLLTCLMTGILLGLVCQLVSERTKPPFPPSPYQLYRWHRIPSSEEEVEERERNAAASRQGEPPVVGGPTETVPRSVVAAPVVGYILRQPGTGSSSSPRQLGSRSSGSGQQVQKFKH